MLFSWLYQPTLATQRLAGSESGKFFYDWDQEREKELKAYEDQEKETFSEVTRIAEFVQQDQDINNDKFSGSVWAVIKQFLVAEFIIRCVAYKDIRYKPHIMKKDQ